MESAVQWQDRRPAGGGSDATHNERIKAVAIPLLSKLKAELDNLEDHLVVCQVVEPTA